VLIWSMAWAAPPPCPAGTALVYRCTTSDQYALLCAGPTLEAPQTLQYVHGKAGQPPDMVWPQPASMAPFGFFGSEGESYAVRFVNGGYTYRLWAEMSMAGMPTGGVTVEKGGKRVASMSCNPEVYTSGFFSHLRVDPLAEKPAPEPPAATPLCEASQRDVLTCKVKDKVLSVCGTADGLQYRYGAPGKPELVTPATPSLTGLSFEITQGAHAATRTIVFPVGDTQYRVWSFEPDSGCCGDIPAAGVEVMQKDKVLANLTCTWGPASSLAEEELPWKAP
jgi:hypothetical protein